MDEEDNPFKMEKPNIDPLMSVDLNSSILSAERQKSNIVNNPWEISEGEDILKSIMEIKNKKRMIKIIYFFLIYICHYYCYYKIYYYLYNV